MLEVVASIAVVAIGIAVIIRSFSYSLRASKTAQEYFEAGILLQNKLCELEEREKLDGGVTVGESLETPQGDTGFTVRTKIEHLDPPDALDRVGVSVSWENKNRSESMEIDTLLRDAGSAE